MADVPTMRLSVECTICIEIFKRPKVLSCGHSFCAGCLEQMIRVGSGSFDCPICRQTENVGKLGVDKLKDNYALGALVDSLQTSLGNQAGAQDPPTPTRREANPGSTRGDPGGQPKKEEKKIPTCVRHPGKKLEASCNECEDTVCGQCIASKCRRLNHKVVPIAEKAKEVRLRLKLLLLGAAFSQLKDNMTIGAGLVEAGTVRGQAETVRQKIFEAHARALKFTEQKKQQYLEIIRGTSESRHLEKERRYVLQDLQRYHHQMEEILVNWRDLRVQNVGEDVAQDIVSTVREKVEAVRKILQEAEGPSIGFDFIGYPPDGSVGELIYDKGSTIGVLSLSGGRLIVARDDRRVAGVCIGEVHQDTPANVKWLFTLKPANYVATVVFCTLSLSSPTENPEQKILIAVGQEIFIIDVNSCKYPTSPERCPAQGIVTVCPKSMPKNATITGIDWYPIPLKSGSVGFSDEFVIYTTDKCHDLTVVSTTTGLNVKVITSSIFLSLVRCHEVGGEAAILVRQVSSAKVLMIDPNGNIKQTFTAPPQKSDANPTLLCWVELPKVMAAVLWVPVTSRGWEIVLYDAESGIVAKTVRGTGDTPTGLDGLIPDKLVMCFSDGAVRICAANPVVGRQTSNPPSIKQVMGL